MSTGTAKRQLVAVAVAVAVALAAAVTILGAFAAVAPPAAAAGNPVIDHYIVSDPEPGWSLASPSVTELEVTLFQNVESSLAGETVTAAAEGWLSGDGGSGLAIILAHLPSALPLSTTNAQSAATGMCANTGGTAAVGPDPAIALSEEAICSDTASPSLGPAPSTVIAWTQGNILAIVEGQGAASRSSVEAAALAQHGAIPATGIVLTGATSLWLIALIALAVLAIALFSFLVLRRRKVAILAAAAVPAAAVPAAQYRPAGSSAAPGPGLGSFQLGRGAGAPARGWHPLGGNPYELRYFDGVSWIAHKRWDGQGWLDVTDSSR